MKSIIILLLLMTEAMAHGPADWIRKDGYRNKLGEACCGELDCREIPAASVTVTPKGYFLTDFWDMVPFSETTPSPTGTYWVCHWAGRRKCFFAPLGTM